MSVTICEILVKGIIRNNSLNYFEFGSVVHEDMSFKRLLIWSPGSPPVQWSKIIYALLKRHHEEHSCEVIGNWDQWFRKRCRLKTFLIKSSDSPFYSVDWNHLCILEEGIMRNNPVKLF